MNFSFMLQTEPLFSTLVQRNVIMYAKRHIALDSGVKQTERNIFLHVI